MDKMSKATVVHRPADTHVLKLIPRADFMADSDSASSHEVANTERRIFQLDARFERGGAWAGVKLLVEAAYRGLLEVGKTEIVEEHDYELFFALPRYRDKIRPKYLCLTDTATGTEKTRFYPLERSHRLVHGLVGLVIQWRRTRPDPGPWVIIVRHFDQAQHLAMRFIAELARRAAPQREIDVFIETENGQSEVLSRMPGMWMVPAEPWVSDIMPDAVEDPLIDDSYARTLEDAIASGSEATLEDKYPMLLEYHRCHGNGLAAARIALSVLSLYNRRGYYHEAKSLIDTILPYLDQLVEGEEFRRMNSISEINSCLIATGDAARALRVVTELAIPHITKPHLLANINYILAMHHLRYLETKDLEWAEQHILQAVDLVRAAENGPATNEHAFLKAFIDNGLAFLRVRQKRHQEALDLCQSGYESVTSELGEHRHLLHRSVLKYNMAQVYAMLGRLEEALDCYETASAMDPFYAEYLAEIGNILQQLDRDAEAIDYYTRAIRYSRPYPEVYLSKAISHARQEQWSDALICSSISLELNPDQPDLYAARADILTELGQPRLALAEYDRAIAIGHDSIAMRVNRAVLHFNNGTYELALSDMDDVVARDTHDAAHYENRAAIYQAMGRQDLYSREIEMAKRYTEHA